MEQYRVKEPPCPDVTLALAVDFFMRMFAEDSRIDLSCPGDVIMTQFLGEVMRASEPRKN